MRADFGIVNLIMEFQMYLQKSPKEFWTSAINLALLLKFQLYSENFEVTLKIVT